MNRAYYTSPDEWVDPDCTECGGEGAPCCEPPYTPPTVILDRAQVTRQIKFEGGRTWRRTVRVWAEDWVPDKEEK